MADAPSQPWLADRATVTGGSAVFSTTMAAAIYYLYVSDVATWITQDAAPVAAVNTANNMFVPAGFAVIVRAVATRTKIAVIKHTGAADGTATLVPILR